MLHHRLCVIGLPRSGSQYAVELIKNNGLYPYLDLIEPFEIGKPYILLENNKIKLSNDKTCDEILRIENALDIINKADKDQPIITRAFYVKEQRKKFKEIIDTLITSNFDFVVLKRNNVEQHLISYGLALKTDIWTKFQGTVVPQKIEITHFNQMKWLYEHILYFNEYIENLNITYDLLHYESIENDLSKIVGFAINTNTKIYKQANAVDPYVNIINADEVKSFMNKLLQ